jgi:hypothetical protein
VVPCGTLDEVGSGGRQRCETSWLQVQSGSRGKCHSEASRGTSAGEAGLKQKQGVQRNCSAYVQGRLFHVTQWGRARGLQSSLSGGGRRRIFGATARVPVTGQRQECSPEPSDLAVADQESGTAPHWAEERSRGCVGWRLHYWQGVRGGVSICPRTDVRCRRPGRQHAGQTSQKSQRTGDSAPARLLASSDMPDANGTGHAGWQRHAGW